MIQPLRRRHRLLIPVLLVLVIIAAGVCFTHPATSSRVDALPSILHDTETTGQR
jgi:hypothetical protein